jgi:murein DD-endopeptidase MepM/ murein hydrolase activator NlpD
VRIGRSLLVPFVVAALVVLAPSNAVASGAWTWPVVGPVLRGFEAPTSPYSAGHRGIDIVAPFGTPVRAAATGVVSFAGPVGGSLFVSVNHGGGVISSYSFLSSIAVRKGDTVTQGAVVARSGNGHPGETPAHLHFGVRVNGTYVDPMDFLSPPSVAAIVRLAPLAAG